jgi:hypothetical protein
MTHQCPSCKSLEIIPIVYGLPDQETLKQYNDGEIFLGGPDDADAVERWHCTKCELNWK